MDYLSKVITAAIRGEVPPEKPRWNKWVHKSLSMIHCRECLMLHNCWFEKSKTPKWPHHEFCHCKLKDISYDDVMSKSKAECPYSKFDPYLFDVNNFYKHGKSEMLESWGYSVKDSKYLQKEIERQGLQKYINGDYVLGALNGFGQRISIRVEIENRNSGGTVSFITGWMVHANGRITLNTPYGGK